MKDVIWKFPLKVMAVQTVDMPPANILSVQFQNNQLCLWAECEPEAEAKPRTIEIFGTGHVIPKGERQYLGTVQQCSLVWHVYYRLD